MEQQSKRKLLYFLAGIITCIAVYSLYFSYSVFKDSECSSDLDIVVEPNSSGVDIAQLIVENKITDNVTLAKATVGIMGFLGYHVKVGEYLVPRNTSLYLTIKILAVGKKIIRKITIPEGFSIAQVIDRLNENEFLTGQINEIPEEGSLMPDTYCFCYPTERQKIINQARQLMKDFISKEWPKRSQICNLKTPREVIILASIVEKESFLDRELVASVYLNRLKKNMRLQADPTVIYGLTKGHPFMRKLLYRDLKNTENPYNTYRKNGLPPTAIANPGRESILAVLHPADSEYLFFVLDKDSRHIFSKNFRDHKQIRKNISTRQGK